MAPQFPSIQSFFQASKPISARDGTAKQPSTASTPRDGFTSAEVDAVLHPSIDKFWTPTEDYAETDIADLAPGPRRITFQGRVANLYDQPTPSKKPHAAKGCMRCIVKDDSGAVTVRLWYANMQYCLRLGHLVSIWAPHVSRGEHGTLSTANAPLFVSIFPERDRSCHFMIHDASDQDTLCKTPLGYREGQQLGSLMTLSGFLHGGYDVSDGKILVVVKSVGPRKKVQSKKGRESEVINVNIFDNTTEATLSLWASATSSASTWKPSETVLLITNPGWRIDRRVWISLTANTMVDIDPCINDTNWLRRFAQRLTRRECVQPMWPDKVSIIAAEAAEAQNRILFTFALLDEFARANIAETFSGYLSVLLTELHIALLSRRRMLCCNECCGVPIFANTTSAKCKQCQKSVPLLVNPRILGPVIDETGTTGTGKLVLSQDAWISLLGRGAEELCKMTHEELKHLEARLLFMRVTLCFAWFAEEAEGGMGRLWIWGVRV